MSWLTAIRDKLKEHFIKSLSAIGMALVSIDAAGYADQVKAYADQYLGGKASHYIGFALFALCFLRASFITWGEKK